MKHPLLAKSCITLISLGILSAGANSALAQETDIGSVAAANPTIEGTPLNASTRVLELGARIFENEIIATSNIGSGQFVFLDQTTLTVSPGSEIILDRYVFDAARGTGEIVLSLSKGVLRFIGGRITKSGVGVVNTPHATIGIRGGIAAITVGEAECPPPLVNQRCTATSAVFLAGVSMTVEGKSETIVVTRAGGMVTVSAPESESSETADSDPAATEPESSDPADADAADADPAATEPAATEPATTEVGEPVYQGVATGEDIGLIFESTDTGGDGGTTDPPDPVIVAAVATDSGLTDVGAESPGAVEQQPISTEGEEAPPETQEESTDTGESIIEDIQTDPDNVDPPPPPDEPDILPLATPIIPATWTPSVPITHAFTGGYAAGQGQSTIPGPDPDPYVMRSPNGDSVIMGFDADGNTVFAEFGPLDTFGSADISAITLNFGSGASSGAFLDDNVFAIDAPVSETGALTGQAQSFSKDLDTFFGTDPDINGQTAMVGTVSSAGLVGDMGIFPPGTDTTPEFLRWGWWAADYQFDDISDSPGGVAPRSETLSGTWVDGVRTDDIAVLGTSGEAQFRGLATAHVTGGSGPELQGGSFTLIYDFGDRSGGVSITGIAGTTFVSTVTGSPTGSGNHFGGALLDFSQVDPLIGSDPLVGSIDGSFFTGAGDSTAATGGAFDFTRQIPGDVTVTQTGAGIFAADKDTN